MMHDIVVHVPLKGQMSYTVKMARTYREAELLVAQFRSNPIMVKGVEELDNMLVASGKPRAERQS